MNCAIIDVSSAVVRAPRSIGVTNGRIVTVTGPAAPHVGDTEHVVDLDGRFVIPGLWDVHCHPGMAGPNDTARDRQGRIRRIRATLQRCQASGVTGLRSVGEAMRADVAVRDSLRGRTERNPELFVTGPALKPPGGHGSIAHRSTMDALCDPWGSIECVGPSGFRTACRALIQEANVDWIKLFVSGGISGDSEAYTDTHMSQDEVEAVCTEAHGRGVRVAAHAGNPEAVTIAALGGVDSIEHGYFMTEKNVALIADRDIWYVPTLSITHNVSRMHAMSWSPGMINKARSLALLHRQSVLRAKVAGVRFASGSDMRPVGPSSVEEAVILARYCFSPSEALKIATLDSADLCGASSDYGSVEEGKMANFIVTSKSPFDDIQELQHPYGVITAGQLTIVA